MKRNSIFLIIICLFFFLFSSSGIVRFISITLIFLWLISYIFALVVIRSLKLERQFSIIREVKNRTFKNHLVVKNPLPFSIYFCHFSDRTGTINVDERNFMLELGPFAAQEITYTCSGPRRGIYYFGPGTFTFSDPAGLFVLRREVPSKTDVIIYPTIFPVFFDPAGGIPIGSLRNNNKLYEDVTLFRSLREYVPGDELKRINWKATAKTGKLQTIEYDGSMQYSVLVLLNLCANDYPMKIRETMIEKAMETAASYVYYFSNSKLTVNFGIIGPQGLTGEKIITGQGYEISYRVLEILAIRNAEKGRADYSTFFKSPGFEPPAGLRTIIIGPEIQPEKADIFYSKHFRWIEYIQIKSSMTLSRIDSFDYRHRGFSLRTIEVQ